MADVGRSGQRVLVGSQNFSVASLGYNRELGILTSDPHIVAAISATLAGDYARAASYSPPSASGSGAKCTATASVYDASRDENNVYVHSNRPDQEAIAKADGYAHSYRTNGSGYALLRFPASWPRASSGSAAVIMLLVVSVRRVPEMESGIRA